MLRQAIYNMLIVIALEQASASGRTLQCMVSC
jgi:hypothetical protein